MFFVLGFEEVLEKCEMGGGGVVIYFKGRRAFYCL